MLKIDGSWGEVSATRSSQERLANQDGDAAMLSASFRVENSLCSLDLELATAAIKL
jgi:hypothetical protein